MQWTRLSGHRCVANQGRRQLFILADTLGHCLRRLMRPKVVQEWSLSSVPLTRIKTGARLVRHARRLVVLMAEGVVPRDIWPAGLGRIGGWRLGPG